MADVAEMSFLAVGRKYGVSDKAVRKWIRWYEYQREMAEWRDEEARAKETYARLSPRPARYGANHA